MEHILVIDDELGMIDIISAVLKDNGYSVTGHQDSEAALKAIRENSFDIVITDLKMPKRDGIQITQEVKKISPETEVIIITGYASLGSAIEALKSAVFDYIFKPFNLSEIVMTVNKVAERIRLRRLNQELNHKIEKALSDLTMLYEVSKIINSSEEIEEMLSFAVSTIESSLDLTIVSIMLFNEQTMQFHIVKSTGFSDDSINNFTITLNQGIIGNAIQTNETVVIADFENDESYKTSVSPVDKEKITSFIAIPLYAQNHLQGLITVHQLPPAQQDYQEKLRLLEVMSVQLAPMLLLGQHNEERKMLLTDSLHGAKSELINTIKKAGEYRGTLSILIFKLYLKKNANYNIMIFDIGELIYSYIVKNITALDSAVKIGLDSFMVILQGKTKMDTEKIAAKIKTQVEADAAITQNGILLDYGYADFPMDGQTFDVLVSKAQANLWKFVKT
jgi:DNA-binding response OmpR family regulator